MKSLTLIMTLCTAAVTSTPVLADRDAGRDVFSARCIACHAIECNRAGPKLGGVIGRQAGTVSDYSDYSDAMKNSNIVWTEETLDAYLADLTGVVPNNGMAVVGNLEDPAQRQDVIDFLKEPDSSLDLCF